MKEVCEGVKYLHNFNIIHRDLNPKNIMFDGNTPVVIDFSSAETLQKGEEVIKIKGSKIGTPPFSAPEQFDRGESSKKSDIYSLGMTYLFILVGEVPEVNNDKFSEYVSERVSNSKARQVILSCIEQDTQKRIKNVVEVQKVLSEIALESEEVNTILEEVSKSKGTFLKMDGKIIKLKEKIVIGRQHECDPLACKDNLPLDIFTDSPFVSRHHIIIRKNKDNRIFVVDLGSKKWNRYFWRFWKKVTPF
ncbi:Serine/threonine protein kinase-related domain protein [mine drainage metagenome]|uniref:non-specific serine/threonine protein kinase n=1 Tax=mine drainage metagenome TaxID=410659 RepID=T1DAT0_9ZZZZ